MELSAGLRTTLQTGHTYRTSGYFSYPASHADPGRRVDIDAIVPLLSEHGLALGEKFPPLTHICDTFDPRYRISLFRLTEPHQVKPNNGWWSPQERGYFASLHKMLAVRTTQWQIRTIFLQRIVGNNHTIGCLSRQGHNHQRNCRVFRHAYEMVRLFYLACNKRTKLLRRDPDKYLMNPLFWIITSSSCHLCNPRPEALSWKHHLSELQ